MAEGGSIATGARRLWLLIALVASAFLIFQGPSPTSAHFCVYPDSVKMKVERADVVFQGRVIAREPEDSFVDGWYCIDNYGYVCQRHVATFDVSKVWKGPAKHRISVVTDDGVFGYRLEVDGEYLVYGRETAKATGFDYSTGGCSGTLRLYPDGDGYYQQDESPYGRATDFDELGRGRVPGALQLWNIVAGTIAAFVLAVGGLKVYRRLGRRGGD